MVMAALDPRIKSEDMGGHPEKASGHDDFRAPYPRS
jgi:hypothetical protein